MSKTALITGINGMDGSHLADFLLVKGYRVYGMERRSSVKNRTNTAHLEDQIVFLEGDLTDQNSIVRCLNIAEPDEVYNLAAQSFVGSSWMVPEQTGNVTGLGVLRVLEAIREVDQGIRMYQASTSEMFGYTERPADEAAPLHPRSPYGAAKVYGHHITINYRESYNMFCVSGICFNHESERRGFEFVTRKISHHVAMIERGDIDHIKLGNIDAQRDWGYAPDYVEAMWMMLQQDAPEDYVICTGETHSVRHFLKEAFGAVGISNWEDYIKYDHSQIRPADIKVLRGNAYKIKERLGWSPKCGFDELVRKMVYNDVGLLVKQTL